jgi:L-amino acid ligase C-terminal domain 2
VNGVEDVRITAKLDQRLVPLPEGASYLGFIFARASDPDGVEKSLREAHRRLRFTIDRAIAVNDLLPSAEEIPAD